MLRNLRYLVERSIKLWRDDFEIFLNFGILLLEYGALGFSAFLVIDVMTPSFQRNAMINWSLSRRFAYLESSGNSPL